MRVDAMRDRLGPTPWVQRVVKLAVLLAHAGLGLAAMLAFSGCGLPEGGLCTTCGGPNFSPGPTPQSHVVFCDIERFGSGFDNTSRVCADSFNQTPIVPLTRAALALNTGERSQFALDKSGPAVGRCGTNGEVVQFQDQFPQGSPVCLNCGAQIPSAFADGTAVCVARCEDIVESLPPNPSSATAATFCANHAHVSTNVPVGGCPMGFDNACTDGGVLLTTFSDPRIFPEPVIWTNLTNVGTSGTANNTLTQNVASVPVGQYQAQAESQQAVVSGDAYLEFSAGETNLAKIIGIRQNCNACGDSDPSPNDISFAAQFGDDGNLYELQNGVLVPNGGVNGSLTPYAPGDRFRISVIDQNDGTFAVRYTKLVLPCTPGSPCNDALLKAEGTHGTYPFTVDTSLRDVGASLTNVTLVRIHQ